MLAGRWFRVRPKPPFGLNQRFDQKVPVFALSLTTEKSGVSCHVPVAVVQRTAVRGKLTPS